MSTRAENERRARVLRDQGWLLREIAAEMGVAKSTVDAWLNDPGGVRLAARKASYGGRCVDCGAPTDGSSGRAKSAQRCAACRVVYQREQAQWTQETVVEALREFAGRYGRTPAASDFHPATARRLGHAWRAERFYADGCYPHLASVLTVFGTWNAALDAAGLPRNQNQPRRRVAA